MIKWKHDCDNCTFLGKTEYNSVIYDLYFCDGTLTTSIVARYGDEGYEYQSMNITNLPMFEDDLPLNVGLEIAKENELL